MVQHLKVWIENWPPGTERGNFTPLTPPGCDTGQPNIIYLQLHLCQLNKLLVTSAALGQVVAGGHQPSEDVARLRVQLVRFSGGVSLVVRADRRPGA